MSAIDVVSDANVALKWFHAEARRKSSRRALLDAHRSRDLGVAVLDLTPYEIGNALMRGRAGASAEPAGSFSMRSVRFAPGPRHRRLSPRG